MSAQRELLKEVAFAFVRHTYLMEQASMRGDEDKRDEHFSALQDIENSVTVTEHNRSWREPTRVRASAGRGRRRP